ncbi:hypothetical protein [Halobacteriovorax sp. HLS]|uniref:hypothetical protein n=1 Tax=Halobacteriovorax sp. HLS TaxID=2234000 RepID=UPI000FDB423F|nr:hypothetical protein [Halobacteriovorax sp. HLS]
MIEKAKDLYAQLIHAQELVDNSTRRKVLIDSMRELEASGVNCQSCTGCCCTFISNSMQTDGVQTLELYIYLHDKEMWNDSLISRLNEVIKNNRLDYEISTGQGSSFRRTYTCPFYNSGPKGCSISPESKPFGCLAFNALGKGVSAGENCTSNIEVLKQREDIFENNEQRANVYLKSILSLDWDKLPMPVALLRLHESIGKIL